MKLNEVLSGLEIEELRADNTLEISDITYDSRLVKPGTLFVAVTGFERDGHEYIASAVERGAAAVLCTKAPDCEIPYIKVEDSRYAMAIAAANFHGQPAAEMKLIGVTGTNGKTTTTMLLKHVIETAEGAKVGLIGTNRNMIGELELETEHTTPESCELQRLLREMADAGCKYVVMEVSSHSLVLHRVAGLRFEVAVYTNLTQDHLDFHSDMDDYASAKSKLFKMSDHGVVNIDDDYAQYILDEAQCDMITYSALKNEADVVAKDIRLSTSDVKFCALSTGVLERVSLGIPGKFSVYNALAVIACGMRLGYSTAEMSEALASAPGVKGRVETVPTDGDYSIVIDYAHTPDALMNVIRSMKEASQGRLVVLFGCGGDRDRKKRPLMGEIAVRYADYVIVTSDNPRTEEPGAIIQDILSGMGKTKTPYAVIEDRREAIAYAMDKHKPGDMIILAGKGHETYQIIGKEKFHMDEREIVSEHLAKRRKTGRRRTSK